MGSRISNGTISISINDGGGSGRGGVPGTNTGFSNGANTFFILLIIGKSPKVMNEIALSDSLKQVCLGLSVGTV